MAAAKHSPSKSMQEGRDPTRSKKLANECLNFHRGLLKPLFPSQKKKRTGYQIHQRYTTPLNGKSIRDSGMPPSVDEFSETFAIIR
jgi:hypothetical protein